MPPRQIKFKRGFIFVDVSYLVFYRYFALKKWFTFANKDIEIKDNEYLKNEVFVDKFKKTLLDTTLKIAKKEKIESSNIIFAFDCHHKDIWRHSLMKEYRELISKRDNLNTDYKGLRADAHEKQNFKEFEIFKLVKEEYLKPFIKENKNCILQHKEAEADDCIAIGIKYLRDKGDTSPIWIIASDTDYLQICNNNTKLIDLKRNVVNEKHLVEKGITNKEYLLNKILVGDVSDNILPAQIVSNEMIDKLKEDYNIVVRKNKKNTSGTYKITNTILKKFAENKDFYKKLTEFMDINKNDNNLALEYDLPYIDKTQFIYNQKMIDFKYIPSKIKKAITGLISKKY